MPSDINPELDTASRASAESVTLRPEDSAEAISALDAFAAEITDKKPDETPAPKTDDTPAPKTDDQPAPKTDDLPAPQPKTDDTPAPKTDDTPAPKTDDTPAPVKDPLDEIELPPHTKPKTAESFANLRTAAKGLVTAATERATKAESDVAKLKLEVEELRKTTGVVPEAIQKELDDLRKNRSVQDIESDPEIKKFDSQITANNEVIYKRLQTAGYSAEHIARIKELGGPDQIEWEPILSKMTVPSRRFIEATLVEGERLKQQKDSALASARANAEEYSKGRAARDQQQVTDFANTHAKGLSWAQQKEVPANATDEQRKAIEQSNEYAKGAQATLTKFLSDRSPERFAEMAVGTLIAHKLNADVIALRAEQKDHSTKLETVTKERDALKDQLDKIKKAQTPRGRTDPVIPPKKPAPDTEVSGEENLDALAQAEIAKASD